MNETNAKKLLFAVADVLEDIGVEFFLKSGTLLGAIKEKKFIDSDRNVDLAMLQENLIPIAKELKNRLTEKGMKVEVIDHRHRRPWDSSIYAFKIRGYGEHAELAGYKKIKGKRALPSHGNDYWEVITARLFEELGEIEFYGRMFKKPADNYLTEYFDNWQSPIGYCPRDPSKLSDFTNSCIRPESWLKEKERVIPLGREQ